MEHREHRNVKETARRFEILWKRYCAAMSSSGEFSTLSSGEATGTGEDSLPSSREATAEAAGSGGGFMPLREFLDRFSLPRVVRVEGAGGRPILLYKQQQRSLRVTATLLMHRYRHDVKVGPEIVIPEGYPGEYNLRYYTVYLLILLYLSLYPQVNLVDGRDGTW